MIRRQAPVILFVHVMAANSLFGNGGKNLKFREMVNTADYQLSMDLLANYPAGYNVFPVANPFEVVNVSIQLALYHIVDMNERDQTLTTNCEIITKWHDVFLMWDPADYDNITDTRLPWDKVWSPDIVLYNSAGDGEQGREMRTLIQVTHDGNVTLLTQAIYLSKCTIDVSYYPFDAQQCELKFASWTTEVTRINMTIGTIDRKKILSLYSPSGVFELKKIFARRHEMPDPCCEDAFADVTYYLVIWRRPKFFLFNYIQPAVLINILALFVFLIPAESGEKITLGISTMLNMTVFLMTVMSGLPPTDQTPILSIYYAITMVLTTAATVLGVLVLRIHHQGRRGLPVPPTLRACARWIAVISFSTYPPVEKQLENLAKGLYRSQPKEDYVYNIKEYDELYPQKKIHFPFRKALRKRIASPKAEKKNKANNLTEPDASWLYQKTSRGKKPIFLTKGGLKLRRSKRTSPRQSVFDSGTLNGKSKSEEFVAECVNSSDEESAAVLLEQVRKRSLEIQPAIDPTPPVIRNEVFTTIQEVSGDSEAPSPKPEVKNPTLAVPTTPTKSKSLWMKARGSLKPETKSQGYVKAPTRHSSQAAAMWNDLSTMVVEERWRMEERKNIIGDEWRQISRIMDRFLFILFFLLSLVNTVWCIFASPHFPDSTELEIS